MTTIERVQAWARFPISMDVTTAILRSEGLSDEAISEAYNTVVASPGYVLDVERGIPRIEAV